MNERTLQSIHSRLAALDLLHENWELIKETKRKYVLMREHTFTKKGTLMSSPRQYGQDRYKLILKVHVKISKQGGRSSSAKITEYISRGYKEIANTKKKYVIESGHNVAERIQETVLDRMGQMNADIEAIETGDKKIW